MPHWCNVFRKYTGGEPGIHCDVKILFSVSRDRFMKMFWVRTEQRRVGRYNHSFNQKYWLSAHPGALIQVDGQCRTEWSEHLPSPCLLLPLSYANSKEWGVWGGCITKKGVPAMSRRHYLVAGIPFLWFSECHPFFYNVFWDLGVWVVDVITGINCLLSIF